MARDRASSRDIFKLFGNTYFIIPNRLHGSLYVRARFKIPLDRRWSPFYLLISRTLAFLIRDTKREHIRFMLIIDEGASF